MNQRLTQQRIRITFGKFGAMRYVGHLDLVTAWERILRRTRIPLEYTQGYNPRPRLQFAAALAVGLTSETELFDAWLTAPLEGDFPAEWIARLNAKSPTGMPIHNIEDVPVKSPSLPQQVTSAEYVIAPNDPALTPDEIHARADNLFVQTTIERQRRKKTYDLRPLLLAMSHDADGHLCLHVKTGEHGNARPDELIDALGFTFEDVKLHRRHLLLDEAVASK